MHHSPLLRGCLTTLVVAAVLVLLRRAGPRAGGIAAAMPTTSLPALAWICSEHGPTFAGAAAGSALLTTALTGLIALLYAHAAPRLVPVHSLGVATLPVVTLAALCTSASCTLAVEVIAAILVLLVCRRLMPAAIAGIGPSLTTRGSNMLFPAVVAGVFTAWIGSMAPDVPAGLCGAVAAIPVIGLSATVSVHGQAGSAMVVNFLHGYLQGLWAKVVFLALLGVLLPQFQPALAWAAAISGGIAVILALRSVRLSAHSWRMPRWHQWV